MTHANMYKGVRPPDRVLPQRCVPKPAYLFAEFDSEGGETEPRHAAIGSGGTYESAVQARQREVRPARPYQRLQVRLAGVLALASLV
jgi:hypothetical protein